MLYTFCDDSFLKHCNMLKGTPEPQDTDEFLLFDLLPDCWQCSPFTDAPGYFDRFIFMHIAVSFIQKIEKFISIHKFKSRTPVVLFLSRCLVCFFLSGFDRCSYYA
jgi:hypothetical protein